MLGCDGLRPLFIYSIALSRIYLTPAGGKPGTGGTTGAPGTYGPLLTTPGGPIARYPGRF